jgi:hypothetical protein
MVWLLARNEQDSNTSGENIKWLLEVFFLKEILYSLYYPEIIKHSSSWKFPWDPEYGCLGETYALFGQSVHLKHHSPEVIDQHVKEMALTEVFQDEIPFADSGKLWTACWKHLQAWKITGLIIQDAFKLEKNT